MLSFFLHLQNCWTPLRSSQESMSPAIFRLEQGDPSINA
jgi:hypothetical protein